MPNYEGRGGHSPGPSKADPMKMKLPKGPAPGASKPALHLAGVVDPALYSDRAVVVLEIEAGAYDKMSPADVDEMQDGVRRELGMRCLILVGARLARIEEPTDDAEAD